MHKSPDFNLYTLILYFYYTTFVKCFRILERPKINCDPIENFKK